MLFERLPVSRAPEKPDFVESALTELRSIPYLVWLGVVGSVFTKRETERLQRSLATTNAIESLLSRTRHVQRHVKRWRGGTMVLRWVAAGVLEAAKGFRRVQGCQDMPALVAALLARDARLGLGESSEMVA